MIMESGKFQDLQGELVSWRPEESQWFSSSLSPKA